MRNPKRIAQVIVHLEAYWKRHPDLRLCQLISKIGAALGYQDTFYLEDDKVLEYLIKENQNAELHRTNELKNSGE